MLFNTTFRKNYIFKNFCFWKPSKSFLLIILLFEIFENCDSPPKHFPKINIF